MVRDNWDDLRYVLAVAETGSVAAAARALGVNHATVLRRVTAFEALHETILFERSAAGYIIPPERIKVIEAAREAALAHDAVSRAIRGTGDAPSSPLRITSTDTFCLTVLPPIAVAFGQQGQAVELLSSNHHIDLARLSADLTVRPALKLPEDFSGDIAGMLGFAAYGPVKPQEAKQPEAKPSWIGLRGAIGRASGADWLKAIIPNSEIMGGTDSFVVMREMVAQGFGRGVLPCCLGDDDPRLVRLDYDLSGHSVPFWVASHVDLADAPRLTRLRRKLIGALQAYGPRLEGW
ncbi:MAG: LysR family transcriptional regulator [Rhodobacteraceae bacterium]|nr:LysR family transcriptional regulator [Paracoccaceae bacterium]